MLLVVYTHIVVDQGRFQVEKSGWIRDGVSGQMGVGSGPLSQLGVDYRGRKIVDDSSKSTDGGHFGISV